MDTYWNDRKRLLFFGLPWTFTKYTLTPEKFLINSGILTIKEEEIRLYRIVDLTVESSLIQRIFGLGTITCNTVDKSMPVLLIQNVKNAKKVKELISRTVEEERIKKRVSSREYMSVDDSADFDEEVQ